MATAWCTASACTPTAPQPTPTALCAPTGCNTSGATAGPSFHAYAHTPPVPTRTPPQLGDLQRPALAAALLLLRPIKRALGLLGPPAGEGTANTALALHAGALLALHEGDLPYHLRVLCSGAVATLGRVALGGGMGEAVGAHPKRDPVTGELLCLHYRLDGAPRCRVGWLDADSREVTRAIDVPLRAPVMMHDMGLTAEYVVLLDVPLVFRPMVCGWVFYYLVLCTIIHRPCSRVAQGRRLCLTKRWARALASSREVQLMQTRCSGCRARA